MMSAFGKTVVTGSVIGFLLTMTLLVLDASGAVAWAPACGPPRPRPCPTTTSTTTSPPTTTTTTTTTTAPGSTTTTTSPPTTTTTTTAAGSTTTTTTQPTTIPTAPPPPTTAPPATIADPDDDPPTTGSGSGFGSSPGTANEEFLGQEVNAVLRTFRAVYQFGAPWEVLHGQEESSDTTPPSGQSSSQVGTSASGAAGEVAAPLTEPPDIREVDPPTWVAPFEALALLPLWALAALLAGTIAGLSYFLPLLFRWLWNLSGSDSASR